MSRSRERLAASLLVVLNKEGGKTKHDLQIALNSSFNLNVTTREINSVLYNDEALFRHDDSSLPRWWAQNGIRQDKQHPAPKASYDIPETYEGPKPRAWQLEAFNKWCAAAKRGVVEAVTGTGKTTVGAIAAAAAVDNDYDALVLVPGLDLMEQWYEKLSRDLPELSIGRRGGGYRDTFRRHHVLISTVQSAIRSRITPVASGGLLVADEVHRYGAEKFAGALLDVWEQRLGLTATYEREDHGIERYLRPYFSPTGAGLEEKAEIVAKCGYARGLADRILAPFRVALVAVKLTDREQLSYNELDEQARRMRHKLIMNHGCPEQPFGEFMKAVAALSEGGNTDPTGTGYARSYLGAFTKRRALLAESDHKLASLKKLIKVFGAAEKALVFTQTKRSAVAAAHLLTEAHIPAKDFTSDLDREERKRRLGLFRSGKIRVLAAPKILDEGIDIPEADLGVIVSASQSRRQMIQRMGRIIRPKSDRRSASFIVLYVKGTTEDPELGAHSAFINEMLDIAEDVSYFGADTEPVVLHNWYMISKLNRTWPHP